MDPALRAEICRRGGIAAHAKGNAHEFTPEEARIAGRKGGYAASQDRNRMREIGRKGGFARDRKYGGIHGSNGHDEPGRGESETLSEARTGAVAGLEEKADQPIT